jgi:hypothetical protein
MRVTNLSNCVTVTEFETMLIHPLGRTRQLHPVPYAVKDQLLVLSQKSFSIFFGSLVRLYQIIRGHSSLSRPYAYGWVIGGENYRISL